MSIRAATLEGNLEGDSAGRDVTVFLPPTCFKDRHRHYPGQVDG